MTDGQDGGPRTTDDRPPPDRLGDAPVRRIEAEDATADRRPPTAAEDAPEHDRLGGSPHSTEAETATTAGDNSTMPLATSPLPLGEGQGEGTSTRLGGSADRPIEAESHHTTADRRPTTSSEGAPTDLGDSPHRTEAGTTVFVGMGSNVGDRLAALQGALDRLARVSGVTVEAVSPVYETEAHVLPGAALQPDHLNAVARLRTTLAPHALLDVLHATERAAGRDPEAPRWSPRPLDLDVLLWDGRRLQTDRLTVPHPRLADRRFVLAPLADLARDLRVPDLGAVADLLTATSDRARLGRFPGSLSVPSAVT
ncbi:MAG: 2-amino-4-hydroxy-6-hydroxymethyldihydropteridine diphosphokinase [Bacteroidota bacterium]